MKKFILSLALGLCILSAFPVASHAATPSISIPKIKADAIPVYLKFQNRTRIYFAPLISVKNVSYVLSYKSNGVDQGVAGSFTPGKNVVVIRDIPMETCSGNVCVKHKNVSNIKLVVTFEYKDNSTSTKTYNVNSH